MLWLGTICTHAAATLLPNGEQCFQSTSPTSGGLAGPIATLGTISGGSGYTNGAYSNVPLTGGSGFNATANITVSAGAVVNVTVVNPGTHYAATDTVSAATANLGGTGSSFSVPVSTVFSTGTGFLGLLGAITGGSGGVAGLYPGVALTGGSGSGATANITVAGGAVTAVVILNPGVGYQVADTLSAASGSIGGVTGFSVPVSSVSINQSLAGGQVFMYVPNSTTTKQTWKNAAQTILNTNPVILDQNGCAIMYGTGSYRQILQDALGNTVWDQVTTDTSAQQNVFWAGIAGGTPNAITLTDPGFNATDGSIINFTALSNNTGATTINPSGFGNITVLKDTSAGPQSLTGGELIATNPISVIYRLFDASFHILNPIVSLSTGNSIATLLGYCTIDGSTFAANVVGIQNAINTTSCKDIYIPAGTYSGTTTLTIARSNLKLHGANGITSPQGIATGSSASTILSFSCFNNGSSAVVVGNGSPSLTFGGIDISDLEILLPATCNMQGLEVKSSTPDSGNMVRRVRVTEISGAGSGTGIQLDTLVYSWRFEDVIIDHFANGYLFQGQNHFTNIIGGQVRNNQIAFNHETSTANQSSNIIVAGVDIEGNSQYAFDIWSTGGFSIRDNYIDNGFAPSTRAIRIGGGSSVPEGISIQANYFNNGGGAQYAIEIASNGFYGLNIIGNHFNGYATANVLNNGPAASSQKGNFFGNDKFGSVPETTSWQGFMLQDSTANRNFNVANLPTCNFLMQGARYFVNDQNTATTYQGAVTGGGGTGQGVICNGSSWLQD